MLLLIIPLLETMAMHYLAATNEDRWAIDLVRQLRRLIPILYVMVVVISFLIVLKLHRLASIVAAISLPLIGIVGLVQIMQVGGRTKRMKQSSIAALVRTPVDNEERFEECASKVFHAFDVDVSTAGTLEALPNSVLAIRRADAAARQEGLTPNFDSHRDPASSTCARCARSSRVSTPPPNAEPSPHPSIRCGRQIIRSRLVCATRGSCTPGPDCMARIHRRAFFVAGAQ